MRNLYLFLLAGIMSISVLGCTQQQADTVAEKTENAAETAGQATENAAEAAGQATENAAETAGQATENAAEGIGKAAEKGGDTVSNAGVTAKIKNALLLSTIIDSTKSHINVDTTDTQVILKGDVMTPAESKEAEKIAKANAGNRTVDNQLHVGDHTH